MRVLTLWHDLQAQGLYVLPPMSQGLQPGLSDTLDVWRGVLSGAAGKLEERYDALDKQLKGRPSIRQSVVRAFQVYKASLCRCGTRKHSGTFPWPNHILYHMPSAMGSMSAQFRRCLDICSGRVKLPPRSWGRSMVVYVGCCVQGVGPSIVADICQGAGIDADLPVVQLQQEDWSRLYEQWREWLLTISSGAFAPHLDAASGSLSVLGCQRARQPHPDSDGVYESSAPRESVHELLDGALRSTEVQRFPG